MSNSGKAWCVFIVSLVLTFSVLNFVLGARYRVTFEGEKIRLLDKGEGKFYTLTNGWWR